MYKDQTKLVIFLSFFFRQNFPLTMRIRRYKLQVDVHSREPREPNSLFQWKGALITLIHEHRNPRERYRDIWYWSQKPRVLPSLSWTHAWFFHAWDPRRDKDFFAEKNRRDKNFFDKNIFLRWPKSPQYCHLSPCKCFDFHSTPQRIDLYPIVYEGSVCDEVMVLFWFWHTLHNCLLTREKSFVTGRKHGHVKICANFLEEQQNNTWMFRRLVLFQETGIWLTDGWRINASH